MKFVDSALPLRDPYQHVLRSFEAGPSRANLAFCTSIVGSDTHLPSQFHSRKAKEYELKFETSKRLMRSFLRLTGVLFADNVL